MSDEPIVAATLKKDVLNFHAALGGGTEIKMKQTKKEKKASLAAKIMAGSMAAILFFGSIAMALFYILA